MEHLPSPLHSLHSDQTKVPYVCNKSYDGGSFLTYPVREGKAYILPAASSLRGQLSLRQYEELHPTPKEELESFFQTWLFFGLVHEILGDLCSPQDFIRASQEVPDKVMSTSNLISIIETWISKVINGDIVATYDHLAECLRVTFAALLAVNPAFDQRIQLSIASTGEVLESAVNKAFRIGVMDNKCPVAWSKLIDEAPWTESMRAAGWCPSQMFILCQGALSIQSLYYITALRQPESPSRHQSCSKQKCTAYQNNRERYTTQHCIDDCKCADLSVNTGALEDTLMKGQIPLLRVIKGQSIADLRLEILSSQPDSQYVALSHVWADGLGNPHANALPRCQLLRLQSLLQSSNMPWDSGDINQELLLWCDTLCCPVEPSEAKNRALLQMKRTYHDATMVLVLDASLQLHDSSLLTPEEMCTRISSSGWTRRLWTLQEGILGADRERLWFQFRDRAFNIDPLLTRVLEISDKEIGRMNLAEGISSRTMTFTGALIGCTSDDGHADLGGIMGALRHRSVSVETDEPLLIGNLLGLDVEEILNGSDETRVYRMWSLMPSIRPGICKSIIFSLGPRLSKEGFRWAPSTMLDPYEDVSKFMLEMRDSNNEGIPSPRGLHVSLSGYSLSFPARPRGAPPKSWIMREKELLHMRDEHGAWYLVTRRESRILSAGGDFLTDEELGAIRHSNEIFQIIELETELRAPTDGMEPITTSLLVKLVEENEDINYVQSFMHIYVGILHRTESDMFEAAYLCAQQLKESSSARQMTTLQDHEIDTALSSYRTLYNRLRIETYRIAIMVANEAGLAASKRISGRDDSVLFAAVILMLFAGHFVHMGRRTKATQRWCVD